ncbi:MAG: hypothetical protein ACTSYH_03615 [Candidatus Heimdallarchaeaceae archaeon]
MRISIEDIKNHEIFKDYDVVCFFNGEQIEAIEADEERCFIKEYRKVENSYVCYEGTPAINILYGKVEIKIVPKTKLNTLNNKEESKIEENIKLVCKEIQEKLISKNRSYGNSIGNPVKCFSGASSEERINVRMDDKLSRLINGHSYENDDDEFDLLGYLILKRALQHR